MSKMVWRIHFRILGSEFWGRTRTDTKLASSAPPQPSQWTSL